jgi:ABC-type lipoprotein release transport system permease subunit
LYKIILAFRYLYRRKISYFALAAVALCVFIVVVVMTVMTGLVGDFKNKNHNFTGDCVVGTESLVGFPYYEDFVRILEKADFVENVSPAINSYAFVGVGGSQQGFGLEIIGINQKLHSSTTAFGRTLHYHKDDAAHAFEPMGDANLPGCVIGADLWSMRGSRGEYFYTPKPHATPLSITCFPLTTKGALAKAGTDLVNTKTFYLSDFFESGLARVDGSVVFLPFEDAQILCGMKEPISRVSHLYIKFKPHVRLEESCREVRSLWTKFCDQVKDKPDAQLLSGVSVQSWLENRREFIAAMEKEQIMMMAMFSLVGITTVFIIFVVFYMIVSHKTKDIGILKSVGASGFDVVTLFLGFAGIIGIISSAAGIIAGWLFLRNINAFENWLFEKYGFQLWDRTLYAIGEIPSRLDLTMVAVVVGCAVLACLAGAILPSVRAAGERPAETLQVSQL